MFLESSRRSINDHICVVWNSGVVADLKIMMVVQVETCVDHNKQHKFSTIQALYYNLTILQKNWKNNTEEPFKVRSFMHKFS